MGKTELKLEIDALLLKQARAAEIQMTLLLERALKAELGEAAAAARARQWAKDCAPSIEAHNRFIEETERSAPSGATGDPPVGIVAATSSRSGARLIAC